MKLLAIESSTPAASVALGDGQQIAAAAERVDRRGHGSFLVPAMDFCFDQAGWRPDDIDAVVVGIGPGLFTGIRVALATAQGVAAAIGAPLIPVTSLDALAVRAATGHRHIWAVVDIRRGEVAAAAYRPVPGGVVRDGPPERFTPDGFSGALASDPEQVLVVGDWQALPDSALRGMHRVKTGRPRYPRADALLEVAARRAEKDDFPRSDEIRPAYLREPDVAINWQDFREEAGWPGQ